MKRTTGRKTNGKTEEQEKFELTKENIFQTTGNRKPIKPRELFRIQNQGWINFLNDWHEGKLEIPKVEPEHFDAWQREHGRGIYYENFEEFRNALAEWMYTNLRAISRNESKTTQATERMSMRGIGALMKMLQIRMIEQPSFDICFLPDTFVGEEDAKRGEDAESKAEMGLLAQMLHVFLEYIKDFLAKRTKYSVRVCPYYVRKNPECGRVFIAARSESEGCLEHSKLWKQLKLNRAKGKNSLK